MHEVSQLETFNWTDNLQPRLALTRRGACAPRRFAMHRRRRPRCCSRRRRRRVGGYRTFLRGERRTPR